MLETILITLGLMYLVVALLYVFYSWLDLRQRQRDYKRFKEKMDEELIRFLEELTDENDESGSFDRDGGA